MRRARYGTAQFLTNNGLPPGFAQLDSGLIVTSEAHEEAIKSPLTDPEQRQLQEYLQAVDDVCRKNWLENTEERARDAALALALVNEASTFASHIVDNYLTPDLATRHQSRLAGLARDLEELNLILMSALAKAYDWYHRTGRKMPEGEWSRLGKPNLSVTDSRDAQAWARNMVGSTEPAIMAKLGG